MTDDSINLYGKIDSSISVIGVIPLITISSRLLEHVDISNVNRERSIVRKLYPPKDPAIASNVYSINKSYNATSYDIYAGSIILGTAYAINSTINNLREDTENEVAIGQGSEVTLTYYANEGYVVPTTGPSVTGATTVYTKVSDSTCTLTLSSTTGEVKFTISGVES